MPGGVNCSGAVSRENRGAVVGLAVMMTLIVVAVLADVVAPHSPIEQFRENFLTPPVWQAGGVERFRSAPTMSAATCSPA